MSMLGGRWSKKRQNLVTASCERPLTKILRSFWTNFWSLAHHEAALHGSKSTFLERWVGCFFSDVRSSISISCAIHNLQWGETLSSETLPNSAKALRQSILKICFANWTWIFSAFVMILSLDYEECVFLTFRQWIEPQFLKKA